jgi:hypothetical protein
VVKRTSTVELAVLDSSDVVVAGGPSSLAQTGVTLGNLVALPSHGVPIVKIHALDGHLPARSCVPLDADDVGREVVLLFEDGNRDKPIVMGLVQRPGERKAIVLTAEDGITLRSGDASITLHRDGKIVIRGAHVVSHASGVNRIRGGSIELN